MKNFDSAYKVYLLRGYAESMKNKNFKEAKINLEKYIKNYKRHKKDIINFNNFLSFRISQNDFFFKHISNENHLEIQNLVNILTAYAYYPNKKTKQILQKQYTLIRKHIPYAREFYKYYNEGDSIKCIEYYNKYNYFLFDKNVNTYISSQDRSKPDFAKIKYILSFYSSKEYELYLENYWMLHQIFELLNNWNIEIEFSTKDEDET